LGGVLLIGLGTISPAKALTYQPVDFSSSFNGNLQNTNSQYPSGNVTLGGVPFDIGLNGSGGNNFWNGYIAAGTGSETETLNINVGVFGVSEVDTLINTDWGQFGPNSYASIEFIGTGGADYTVNLIGGVDIRDFNPSIWTNTINGTTTTQVFLASNGQRLDKQQFVLPSAFDNQTLTSIVLTDTGNYAFQRTFLSGVSVGVGTAVPEPTSILGAITALGLGTGLKRQLTKKRKDA